jgi:DNA adenine methylase
MAVLRDSPDELIERLQAIPYARELHQTWTTAFFEGHRPSDDIERAARYYFIRRAQYGGEAAKKTGFRATVEGRRNPARQWRNSITRLSRFSERLQNVQLTCQDYTEALDAVTNTNESTFIYADPPYRDSGSRYRLKRNEKPSLDRREFPSFDFGEFVERIKEFSKQNPRVQILVSTDVIPDPLADFHCSSENDSFSMNAVDGVKETTEFLLSNYDPTSSPSHSENATLESF